MFVVKGMNVFPLGVQETLLAFRPQTSAEFFIELPKPPPIDYPPRLCLEVTASVGEMEYEALTEQISQALQRQNNFSVAIELVAQGSKMRWPQGIPAGIQQRIDRELALIAG